MKRTLPWIVASYFLAVAGCVGPATALNDGARNLYGLNIGTLYLIGLACSAMWCVLFAVSLRVIGRRGLWLLIPAPLALWFPVSAGLLMSLCLIARSTCL